MTTTTLKSTAVRRRLTIINPRRDPPLASAWASAVSEGVATVAAAIRADRGADTDCGTGGTLTASQRALETIATGLLSVAPDKVTRPKLMVRPRRTTRASASTDARPA